MKKELTKLNEKYWTYYRNESKWLQVLEATFTDSLIDHKRVKEGRVYNTKEEAVKASV